MCSKVEMICKKAAPHSSGLPEEKYGEVESVYF